MFLKKWKNNEAKDDNLWMDSEFDIDISDSSGDEEEHERKKIIYRKKLEFIKDQTQKDRVFKKRVSFPILAFVIVWIIFYVIYSYEKYIRLNTIQDPTAEDRQYLQDFKEQKNRYLWYIWFEQKVVDVRLSFDNTDSWLKKVNSEIENFLANNDITYIDKKEILEKKVWEVFDKFKSENKVIADTKTDIIKFSFVPKDVVSVIKENEIQRALLSIETIKFFTALKVFSHLWKVIEDIANSIRQRNNLSIIIDQFSRYVDWWEENVERYLKTCYMNTYETSNCNFMWDFAYYYDNNWKRGDSSLFQPALFVAIMSQIEAQLENDQFPKLSIVLNDMDPWENRIAFDIEVNTFKEDEFDLRNEWNNRIKIPHVYIITELINSLRKSHFIIWKDIELEEMVIDKKSLTVFDNDVQVNSSNFSFDIPIQEATDKEIYDYIYR